MKQVQVPLEHHSVEPCRSEAKPWSKVEGRSQRQSISATVQWVGRYSAELRCIDEPDSMHFNLVLATEKLVKDFVFVCFILKC